MALCSHVKKVNHSLDPLPELEADSHLWDKLLRLTHEVYPWNELLLGILHGFRCSGTMIVKGANNYILRPNIDQTQDLGWRSEKDYKEATRKWLEPYRSEVKKLLSLLSPV